MDEIWGKMSPKQLGWILISIAGFFLLIIYALFVLCLRKCIILCRTRAFRPNRSLNSCDYPRAHLQEPLELALIPVEGLELNQPVNLYEVVMPTRQAGPAGSINSFVPRP